MRNMSLGSGWLLVDHLSENNRRQELVRYHDLSYIGWSHREAMASAKSMGLRRKRHMWNSIKWNLYKLMRDDGHGNYWIDMARYRANVELLDWCFNFLPFRAEEKPALSSGGAQSAARSRHPLSSASSSAAVSGVRAE